MRHIIKHLLPTLILLSGLNCASVPSGKPGPQAEELTDKMLEAAGYQNWQKTSAVSFTFRNGDKIFWDKNRGLIRVQWDENKVLLRKSDFKAIATSEGKPVASDEKGEFIEDAWSKFTNHTFWLSPMFHVRSPGSVREYADGNLILKFKSGGVTPGDTYLFVPDDQNRIKEMRMWVSIIPVKGATAEFKNYVTTETGVPVALDHELSMLNVTLRDLVMYSSYPTAGQEDIFSPLLTE